MAELKWRHDKHHNVSWTTIPHTHKKVGVGVLNHQWVIVEPDDAWYGTPVSTRLVLFKGRRRYPTAEAAMAACRLIYGG